MVLERQRRGAVEVLTLNRPEARNALDPALLAALGAATRELADDDAVRVLVLTGAGDRAFCAGMDLRAFSERRRASAPEPGDEPARGDTGGDTVGGDTVGGDTAGGDTAGGDTAGGDLFRGTYPKPVVAAVNGAAVGGGFELVLSCDLVVAAEHARFGLPEVRRGLMPGGGGTLLGTRIPLNRALEVALLGDFVDARQAAEWGLVNRVVPAERLLDEALVLAEALAANGPLAVQVTKRLTRAAVGVEPASGWPSPDDLALVFNSDDAREGATAFVEKRAPNWTGH